MVGRKMISNSHITSYSLERINAALCGKKGLSMCESMKALEMGR
jgi:hypothetical protein